MRLEDGAVERSGAFGHSAERVILTAVFDGVSSELLCKRTVFQQSSDVFGECRWSGLFADQSGFFMDHEITVGHGAGHGGNAVSQGVEQSGVHGVRRGGDDVKVCGFDGNRPVGGRGKSHILDEFFGFDESSQTPFPGALCKQKQHQGLSFVHQSFDGTDQAIDTRRFIERRHAEQRRDAIGGFKTGRGLLGEQTGSNERQQRFVCQMKRLCCAI